MNLLDSLFRSAAVDAVFSDRATLQGMLDFEAALAWAESQVGLIPATAADAIRANCRADLFDHAALSEGAARAGNLAIPLVKQLTTLVAAKNKEAARFVHWGATSQDAIDTGRVLQLRKALELLEGDLHGLVKSLATLAEQHRATLIAGRTWMQHALPTTLGVKIAAWLDTLLRHRRRLEEARERCLVLQFGGAVGTLAALRSRGPEVAVQLAAELKLVLPTMPWHSHRDRITEIGTTLGMLAGTAGKIARDLALHMQTEVAEIFEPAEEGRGGSSTMPHKRNPVRCAVILSAALRVPGLVAGLLTSMMQEDERGLGGWHAEWEPLPDIVQLTAGALHHLETIAPKLEIDVERMKTNLDLTDGLIYAEAVSMALAEKMTRAEAHEIVQSACVRAVRARGNLRDALSGDPKIAGLLSAAELDRLFDPGKYLGAAEEYVQRVVGASRTTLSERRK